MPRIVQARKDDRPAKEARISPVEARGASHPGTREARLLFQVCFFYAHKVQNLESFWERNFWPVNSRNNNNTPTSPCHHHQATFSSFFWKGGNQDVC